MPEPSAVTVIVPVCNNGQVVRTCLDSIMAQTVPPARVIAVDDGSEDDSREVIRVYEPRVRLIALDQNSGAGAARNAGLREAVGEYVAFLDADDYWEPSFLERTVSFLEQHPEAIAVSTAGLVRMTNGRTRTIPACVGEGAAPGAGMLDDFYAFWAKHDHVRTGTVLMRRSVIERAGEQRNDLRISQDLEYWGYLATFGAWGFVPEPLWIGDSRRAAKQAGWLRKYNQRRRLCPTVEAWQERIVPRLSEAQRPHFDVVRGRVAAGYAHAKVLGGDRAGARLIVREHGRDFPVNRVTRLMRVANRAGAVGWWWGCQVLRGREYLKGWM